MSKDLHEDFKAPFGLSDQGSGTGPPSYDDYTSEDPGDPEEDWRLFLMEEEISAHDYQQLTDRYTEATPGSTARLEATKAVVKVLRSAASWNTQPAPGRPLLDLEKRWGEDVTSTMEEGLRTCRARARTCGQMHLQTVRSVGDLEKLLGPDSPLVGGLKTRLEQAAEDWDADVWTTAADDGETTLLRYLGEGAPELEPSIERLADLSAKGKGIQNTLKTLKKEARQASKGVPAEQLDEAFTRAQEAGTSTRGFVARLLKLRFNVSAEFYRDQYGRDESNPDGKGRAAHRIYELLRSLPEHHTSGNDAFLKLKRHGKKLGFKGGHYDKTVQQVVLRCSSPTFDSHKKLCSSKELPEIEPDCQPSNPDEEVHHFDWVVLHEVGHAVDESLGFMESHGGSDEFGGWKELDPSALEELMAQTFTCERAYLHDLVARRKTAKPVESDSEEAGLRKEAKSWYTARSSGKRPYDREELAAEDKTRFKGYAVHESYAGTWVKYRYEARQKGLSGYQFRASGEWFAELYAAYHSGKLKPTHPAVKDGKGWLAQLDEA